LIGIICRFLGTEITYCRKNTVLLLKEEFFWTGKRVFKNIDSHEARQICNVPFIVSLITSPLSHKKPTLGNLRDSWRAQDRPKFDTFCRHTAHYLAFAFGEFEHLVRPDPDM
jgi:hypothetical protein